MDKQIKAVSVGLAWIEALKKDLQDILDEKPSFVIFENAVTLNELTNSVLDLINEIFSTIQTGLILFQLNFERYLRIKHGNDEEHESTRFLSWWAQQNLIKAGYISFMKHVISIIFNGHDVKLVPEQIKIIPMHVHEKVGLYVQIWFENATISIDSFLMDIKALLTALNISTKAYGGIEGSIIDKNVQKVIMEIENRNKCGITEPDQQPKVSNCNNANKNHRARKCRRQNKVNGNIEDYYF